MALARRPPRPRPACPLLLVLLAAARAGGLNGGAENCCGGRLVKVGMLDATREPWWKFHAEDDHRCGTGRPCSDPAHRCNDCWSGLVADLHRELAGYMKYTHQILAAPAGSSDAELAALLRTGVVDMLPHELGSATFLPTWDFANFSMPFVTYTYSAMVRVDVEDNSLWRLFNPFGLDLWMVILGALLAYTLVFWVLECRREEEPPTALSFAKGLARAFDFVLASLVGGMEFDGVRNDGKVLGRILRTSLLFFVLIITATYTANLASILTAQKLVVRGPRTMEQLKTARICSFDRDVVRAEFRPYVGSIVTPALTLGAASNWEATPQGRKECLQYVLDGRADAVIANQLELEQMKAEFGFCNDMLRIEAIRFLPRFVSFATRGGDDLMWYISEALVRLQKTGQMMDMMDNNYNSACTNPSDADDKIYARHLNGLYLISGVAAALVLIMAIAHLVIKYRSPVTDRLPLSRPGKEAPEPFSRTAGSENPVRAVFASPPHSAPSRPQRAPDVAG